jgi:hypothetical protein
MLQKVPPVTLGCYLLTLVSSPGCTRAIMLAMFVLSCSYNYIPHPSLQFTVRLFRRPAFQADQKICLFF